MSFHLTLQIATSFDWLRELDCVVFLNQLEGKSYSQSTSCVTCSFEIWTEFWNLHVRFEHRQQDFRVPVENSLVYWWYKAMNLSWHYSIKYFKNNNCFPSILNLFFLLMCLFWKDFQRNVQHSIHMSDITKRNLNVHFILGNTGHTWREWIDCKPI